MTIFDLTASARHTECARLLENFLDDNAGNIAPELFESLNDLAGEMENLEDTTERKVADLEAEIKDLTDQLEDR